MVGSQERQSTGDTHGKGPRESFQEAADGLFWIWCWVVHVCSVCDTSPSGTLALLSMYATLQDKALETASTSSGCFSTCITPGTVSTVGERSVGISSGHLGGKPHPRRQGTPHDTGRSGVGKGSSRLTANPAAPLGLGREHERGVVLDSKSSPVLRRHWAED